MASKTDIINMALALLGEPAISIPTEDTKLAKVAQIFYESARDKSLTDHPWNFAKARAELASEPTAPKFEFQYSYQLPADCLKVSYTEDQWYHRRTGQYYPWKVEGRKLLTDLDECKILYIKRVTEEGYFSPGFVIAFAHYLAYLMSMAMTEHRAQTRDLLAQYGVQLADAKFADAQEGTADEVEEGGWLAARA